MSAYQDELDKIKKERQSQKFGMDQSAKKVATKKAATQAAPKKGMSNTNKAVAAAQVAQSSGALGEQGTTDQGGGMMQGAASGAAMGASFGPYGAAIGAVAGGVMGAASARAAAKAHNAQLEAKKERAIAKIEEEKGKKLSSALNQMGSRMSLR